MVRLIFVMGLCLVALPIAGQMLFTSNGIMEIRDGDCDVRQEIHERKEYLVMWFDGIPDAATVRSLSESGCDLIAFVPPDAYIVRLCADKVAGKDIRGMARKIADVPVALRLSPEIYSGIENRSAFHPGEYVVSVYVQEDIRLLEEILRNLGLSWRSDKWTTSASRIVSVDNTQQFDVLLSNSVISYIGHYQGIPKPETNSHAMFANQIYAVNYGESGPKGRNTYAGNIEYFGANSRFRLNTKGRNHPVYGTFFRDNTEIQQYSHGTQVSSYMASANTVNDYEDKGMADAATLVQIPAYDSIENYYTGHALSPLTLNVSAGVGTSTVDYNAGAREFDRLTRTLKGFMLCFAAGNDGNSTNPHLDYGPGWANISSDDKTSKNNCTVHAAGYPGEHYDWACKGPTSDGRLKPDICAEGQSGTSFASPGLAGLFNVLYESYADVYQVAPRSDVVKAVILNTAIDADKPGIDFKTGFGTLNPSDADNAIREKRIITDAVMQGTTDQHTYTLSVPQGVREFKVLLYWHDFEGVPGAGKALVNDLDLQILTPDEEVLLPWTLDPTPGSQYNLPLRKRDTLNNVEQIILVDPPPGDYQVTVHGSYVPFGPQDFVVTYEVRSYGIEITSPPDGFKAARNKKILFTWNTALDTSTTAGPLHVYLESSLGLSELIGIVPASQHYLEYQIPADFPNTAEARLIVQQQNAPHADTSAHFHVMQTPSGLRFTSVCEDLITLKWESLPDPGTLYTLYRLGEKYMEPVATTSWPVTSISLLAQDIPGTGGKFTRDEWFAISAEHPNGAKSLRSVPVSVQQTSLLATQSYIQKNYTLCFGDSVDVTALDLSRDSLRWFYEGQLLPDDAALSLRIRGSHPGSYTYRIYQSNGCVFQGDTFHVAGPLQYADTLSYGQKIWSIYAFRQHDRQQFYGKAAMRTLSIRSLDHYTEFDQIDRIAGYEGCRPGFVYTLSYKRKGFTPGHYTFDLRYIQYQMRLMIDDVLVYESPSNSVDVGMIWEGDLNEDSRIRIEQVVQGKPLMDLQIVPVMAISPASVQDSLLMWMRGDQVVLDQAGRVKHWLDDYPYAVQNEADPNADIRVAGAAANFRDVLTFHNNGGLQGDLPQFFSNETTSFIVFRMNAASDDNARVLGFGLPPVYTDEDYSGTFSPCRRDGSGERVGLYRNGTGYYPEGNYLDAWQVMSAKIQGTRTQVSIAGEEQLNLEHPFTGLFYRSYSIGCASDSTGTNGQLNGEVAEVIHYTKVLSQEEEKKVTSYLALKYGLTLAADYVAADGRMIYTRNGFAHDVAGLARADESGWRQGQGKGLRDSIFIGSLGPVQKNQRDIQRDFAEDGTYVVWGHNGLSAAFTETTSDTSLRCARVWKLQSSGDPGVVRCNFRLDALAPDLGCDTYVLLLSEEAGLANSERHDLKVYTGADGFVYLYAEVSPGANSTWYFSIERSASDIAEIALEGGSKADIFCLRNDIFHVMDSTLHLSYAQVIPTKNMSGASIESVLLRTDLPEDSLASCAGQYGFSLINRLLEISIPAAQGKMEIIMVGVPEDSVLAAQNMVLNASACASEAYRMHWWVESDATVLQSKLNAGIIPQLLDPESVAVIDQDGYQYISLRDLPLASCIAGAILLPDAAVSVEGGADPEIHCYPNPFTDELYIDGSKTGDVVIIHDVLGRICARAYSSGGRIVFTEVKSTGVLILSIQRNGEMIYRDKLQHVQY